MKKKRTIVLAALSSLAVAAVVIILVSIFPVKGDVEPKTLRVSFPDLGEPQNSTVRRLLSEFDQFYDEYEVSFSVSRYAELITDFGTAIQPDLTILTHSDLSLFSKYAVPPLPWTGSLWGLYYNVTVAENNDVDIEEIAESSWPAFQRQMTLLRSQDVVPFSLGARLGWPWLAWLQHLSKVTGGGSTPEDLRLTAAEWRYIEEAGLVNEDYRSISWADSIRRVVEGRSLFVLFDATILKPLLPKERASLGFMPFPGSQTAPQPWQIGSLLYLVAPAFESRPGWSPDGAKDLVAYFSSEGVVNRLREETGMEIYAASEYGSNINLIPSVTTDARNPVYRSLIESLSL